MRDGHASVAGICGPENTGLLIHVIEGQPDRYRAFWDWHFSHFDVWIATNPPGWPPGWRRVTAADIEDTLSAIREDSPGYTSRVNQALEQRTCSTDTHNEPGDACLNLDYLTQFPNALAAVAAVLQHGDKKHPGQQWRDEAVTHHRGKALGHLGRSHPVLGRTHEKESGLPHMAHAAARLLMALENMLNKENDDE